MTLLNSAILLVALITCYFLGMWAGHVGTLREMAQSHPVQVPEDDQNHGIGWIDRPNFYRINYIDERTGSIRAMYIDKEIMAAIVRDAK